LEANFALRRLAGPERFFLGIPEKEKRLLDLVLHVLLKGPVRSACLQDMHTADAVLVLGEDVTNTAPMVALALRQAVRQQPMEKCDRLGVPRWTDGAVRETIATARGPLHLATTTETKLDGIARKRFLGAPDDIARLGFAVARELSLQAPVMSDLEERFKSLAREISQDLKQAKRPLVVAGTSSGSESVIQAAANVAWALHEQGVPAELSLIVPECNSLGLAMIGGGNLEEAFRQIAEVPETTVIVLENDLYRRADQETVREFLFRAGCVVCLDHLSHATTAEADVVLPAGTFADGNGSLVNNEGRGQRYYKVFAAHDEVRESWRWLRDLMLALDRPEGSNWETFDEVAAAVSEASPALGKINEVAPPEGFRMTGMKIPRQPHRYSGRTSSLANVNIHEPKTPQDPDSPLAFSMEGSELQPPSAIIPRFWSPGWYSIQAVNKFQSEIGGSLRGGDPGLRLIEPAESPEIRFYSDVPAAFKAQEGRWLILPWYHIFGSEELSMMSPGIAERSPRAYVALGAEDAAKLGLQEQDMVSVRVGEWQQDLPLTVCTRLPAGLAGLPVGLAGLDYVALPAWGIVVRPASTVS